MSTYSQIAWLPLTAGLTLVGLIISFFVWRRRGAAAGLRGVAWSLLPLAAFGVLVQRRVRSWWLLLPLAALTWGLVHASGVHATVAGVLLGFTVPVPRS